MIIDYEAVPPDRDADGAFKALDFSAETADIAVEGGSSGECRGGGRAYLAVPRSKSVSDVLAQPGKVKIVNRGKNQSWPARAVVIAKTLLVGCAHSDEFQSLNRTALRASGPKTPLVRNWPTPPFDGKSVRA